MSPPASPDAVFPLLLLPACPGRLTSKNRTFGLWLPVESRRQGPLARHQRERGGRATGEGPAFSLPWGRVDGQPTPPGRGTPPRSPPLLQMLGSPNCARTPRPRRLWSKARRPSPSPARAASVPRIAPSERAGCQPVVARILADAGPLLMRFFLSMLLLAEKI